MRKILIIDDYYEIRENLQEILTIFNYNVITAENGQSGIQRIQQDKPDLVLCDIAMPGKNGYQVLEAIKSSTETSRIPFVFITASADQREIEMGKLAGADGYLAKPFKREELFSLIEGLLEPH